MKSPSVAPENRSTDSGLADHMVPVVFCSAAVTAWPTFPFCRSCRKNCSTIKHWPSARPELASGQPTTWAGNTAVDAMIVKCALLSPRFSLCSTEAPRNGETVRCTGSDWKIDDIETLNHAGLGTTILGIARMLENALKSTLTSPHADVSSMIARSLPSTMDGSTSGAVVRREHDGRQRVRSWGQRGVCLKKDAHISRHTYVHRPR